MKKLTIILLLLLSSFFYFFANPAHNVKEFTLENGLTVFLLEDPSDALVHVTFKVRAGFSSQTKNNSGFFTLFSNLIKAANPQINFSTVECNSDATTFCLTTTTTQINQQLAYFADAIFDTQYSDDLLTNELFLLKNEVTENSKSMSYLINSAIDSKVFSAAPWKHDSGIYPSLFKSYTTNTARTYLNEIKNNWYLPQNSAIFITGNINSELITATINNTFGKYYSAVHNQAESKYHPVNSKKRFVIHDDEFSKELTQVVVQYTLLDLEQCDLLSVALNNPYSTFKQKVLSFPELNIPGDEYINVAAAHKQNNSRLIFQTLIQEPENKKIKTNSAQQSLKFLNQILEIPQTLQPQEIDFAKQSEAYNLEKLCQSSKIFIENLSDFWVIQPYVNYYTPEQTEEAFPKSITVAKLMSRQNYLQKVDFQSTLNTLAAEEPFIFVIINSADFKKNKKEYISAGFTEITSKNSSWYVQEMYKNIREQFNPDENEYNNYNARATNDNEYVKRNLDTIKTSTLNNGITITTKQNRNSTGLSLLINLKGGKYHSADDNGFEEVMANLLGVLITKEIYTNQMKGLILGSPEVDTNTDLFTSQIIINFDTIDLDAVLTSIYQALIYGDIPPAAADRAVSNRQYKKRLENGSSTTQLTAAAMNLLYPKSAYSKIYEAKKEILQDTSYTKILEAYPSLLNAAKYDFILCGDFENEDEVHNSFAKVFSNLEKKNLFYQEEFPKITFPKKTSFVKIVHTFLTDIPAEKAGPQPAVLIPTTEFLDPAIFYIEAPEDSNEQAIFNALLTYLKSLIEKEIKSNNRISETSIQIQTATPQLPFGSIIFTNVKHTKEIESAYTYAIQNLKDDLNKNNRNITENIKNLWIATELEQTSSNMGTVLLLQKGFENFPKNPKPDFYLTQYDLIQKATIQEFQLQSQNIPDTPYFKVYSKDSKI